MRKGIIITPSDLPESNWPERMSSLKLNTLGIHSGGGAVHDVLAVLGDTASTGFRDNVRSLGLDIEYEDHASQALLPRELFVEHPEYFICSRKHATRADSGNWCISNSGLQKLLVANAMKLARQLPSSTGRHFFWGGDSSGLYCHCPDCAELSSSDQQLWSVNLMADALRKERPDASIAFLAYHDTLDVPEKFHPTDGVFLEFAPYNRCYQHALDNPACQVNAWHLTKLRNLLKVFDPAQTQALEYWLDSSWFGPCSTPRKKVQATREVMTRDIQLYYSLGIRSITTFAVHMDAEYFREYGDQELQDYAAILSEY